MGSGMAFPWRVLQPAPLASGEIVEDLMLGLDLARAGTPPLFCPEARVTSLFSTSADGARAQRARWEHGHLRLTITHAPRLVREALAHRNTALLALLADVCVPPLALLLTLIALLLAAAALLRAAGGQPLALWLAGAALGMLALAVLASWLRYGRGIVSFGSLAYAPLYALRKIPLYLAFLFRRQAHWVRSRRDGD
jgi:hypothetical protein